MSIFHIDKSDWICPMAKVHQNLDLCSEKWVFSNGTRSKAERNEMSHFFIWKSFTVQYQSYLKCLRKTLQNCLDIRVGVFEAVFWKLPLPVIVVSFCQAKQARRAVRQLLKLLKLFMIVPKAGVNNLMGPLGPTFMVIIKTAFWMIILCVFFSTAAVDEWVWIYCLGLFAESFWDTAKVFGTRQSHAGDLMYELLS